MNLSFRNRIASYYLFTTASIITLVFILIYFIVFNTVYSHLQGDLDAELAELNNSIVVSDVNKIIFANPFEWNEGEHKQIEVNPTFIQVTDAAGVTLKKTLNLLNDSLQVNINNTKKHYFITHLSRSSIYQVQYPIINNDKKNVGFLLVAIPLEESEIVLQNLKKALIISFPIILIILFLVTRYIAGKSISPINNVILTANRITRENLNERIKLPENKDEIYKLILTINELLDRLEDNLLREKQFTSDASHELRTPLSVIKGTLEVLIRKPREINQYEEKISYCIKETDRMTKLIDQLLLLARYDSGKVLPNKINIDIKKIIMNVINRLFPLIADKEINIKLSDDGNTFAIADISMIEMIFENLITNSVKYSESKTNIDIIIKNHSSSIECEVKDNGIGMSEEQIKKIFDRFFRSDESRNSEVGGFGLGLSIVKKLCDLQDIHLDVKSIPLQGTSFSLQISK